ncbi:NAD(P)H-hydrate epimerase, partial [Streptomyces sp. SID3343]|uniref:NAD(P)H-hydrate epimerase n=1 Tax=Streptomyces sp. SID3343 TaxID=2690260 RepID=UPI00136AF8BE
MRRAHRVEQVRAAEAALMATLPDGALMHRAAAGLATTCARLLGRVYGARVALLVGSGDNGGDALYAGAALARRGARVDALLLAPERAHPGGLAALRRAGGRAHDVSGGVGPGTSDVLGRARLVVDGIVGIGGRGALRPAAAALLTHVGDAIVVAVDVPSGVDADTGCVAGEAVRADVTVTFGTYKAGLLIDPGASHAGARHLVDIGLDPHLPEAETTVLQHADVAALLPRPDGESDKYRRGVLGVVAGSPRYPGAAVLVVG